VESKVDDESVVSSSVRDDLVETDGARVDMYQVMVVWRMLRLRSRRL